MLASFAAMKIEKFTYSLYACLFLIPTPFSAILAVKLNR